MIAMKNEKISAFSLYFLSLTLSSLALSKPTFLTSINSSVSVEDGNTRSGRRLFEEKQLTDEEYRAMLDKLAEGYMTNDDLEGEILAFHSRCSSISRIYSIGKSVQGVPLWVMEISDKPAKKEAEPAFKFIGNVHGDEPVGRELLLRLANWLCDNYMKDPLATLIVNKVHLHILPSMNPDGYSLRTRGNANGIDLNRDFPDQFFPMNDDAVATE
ncbi:hypothetical protein Leryth_005017 [Lithospermum erythrorhizon]|nr:hypothetical protein Leryth_005017 [Lithospermum erythrorhizon]